MLKDFGFKVWSLQCAGPMWDPRTHCSRIGFYNQISHTLPTQPSSDLCSFLSYTGHWWPTDCSHCCQWCAPCHPPPSQIAMWWTWATDDLQLLATGGLPHVCPVDSRWLISHIVWQWWVTDGPSVAWKCHPLIAAWVSLVADRYVCPTADDRLPAGTGDDGCGQWPAGQTVSVYPADLPPSHETFI